MNTRENCLSYWFPKIHDAGLPVPRTVTVTMTPAMLQALVPLLDGGRITDDAQECFFSISALTKLIDGPPWFLRTGQTSGKHSWKNTCCVTDLGKLTQHVMALVEYSECCYFIGLPWDVWAVREMLPTRPVMIAERFGGMPVCREFRVFVHGGTVRCWHPYWPPGAIAQGVCKPPRRSCDPFGSFESWMEPAKPELTVEQQAAVDAMNDPGDDLAEILSLASRAGAAVGGCWSVDILDTANGWFVTDMATAADSFHWPGCPNAEDAQ